MHNYNFLKSLIRIIIKFIFLCLCSCHTSKFHKTLFLLFNPVDGVLPISQIKSHCLVHNYYCVSFLVLCVVSCPIQLTPLFAYYLHPILLHEQKLLPAHLIHYQIVYSVLSVVTDRAALCSEFSVKVGPILVMIILIKLTMCSLYRSHGMFLPVPPRTFTKRSHRS